MKHFINDFLEEASKKHLFSSPGYPAWNLLYYCLTTTVKNGCIILETGTGHGLSTIVMAQALFDNGIKGTIYTVEASGDKSKAAEENVKKCGLETYIKFLVGNTLKILQEVIKDLSKIDFAFLDSGHDKDTVLFEFNTMRNKVKSGNGYVYFDNVLDGGVREALKVIKLENKGDLIIFPNCSYTPPGQAIWHFGERNETC